MMRKITENERKQVTEQEHFIIRILWTAKTTREVKEARDDEVASKRVATVVRTVTLLWMQVRKAGIASRERALNKRRRPKRPSERGKRKRKVSMITMHTNDDRCITRN